MRVILLFGRPLTCELLTEVTLKVLLAHKTTQKSPFSWLFSIAIGYKHCYI